VHHNNCPRRIYVLALVAALLLLMTVTSSAHIAPSTTDNNRYLKVSTYATAVRLSYTVFIGEEPGALARKSIDTDRSGTLSDVEAMVYGQHLADEIAASLQVSIDGVVQKVDWSEKSVGLGNESVAAGAFSVDLVAWFCFAGNSTTNKAHALLIRDSHQLAKLGETEVRIDNQPGAAISDIHIGDAQSVDGDFRFAGSGGPLTTSGLQLSIAAAPGAAAAIAPGCSVVAPSQRMPMMVFIFGGALLAFAAAGAVTWFSRRKAR
jgi:hypothetical protein